MQLHINNATKRKREGHTNQKKKYSHFKGFHNEHNFIFCFHKFNTFWHIQYFPIIGFNICFLKSWYKGHSSKNNITSSTGWIIYISIPIMYKHIKNSLFYQTDKNINVSHQAKRDLLGVKIEKCVCLCQSSLVQNMCVVC